MNERSMWHLFMETGIPEYYLIYRAMKAETLYVSEDEGTGPAGDSLQGLG